MKKGLFFIMSLLFAFSFSLGLQRASKASEDNPSLEEKRDFRAAWVSYYTGDINYKNEADYKQQIDTILDALEYYNMNAIIFHIRANHDAWYRSKLNKVNSQLANVDFDVFDPLEYVITESHKRGIEFHAWLNPYRIGSTYKSAADIASAFAAYPHNPASDADQVLLGTTLQILNPGIPEVRDFIVETCMEIVENYDVDAIHFDDYFYADGIDDSATRAKYNTKNLSVANFRREQVDQFIYQLKSSLDVFNQTHHRFVQLGVSPTGVYKNANSAQEAATSLENYQYNGQGDLVYPIGATTGCQMHYESYLYCDTLKWVNQGWINYILPQTYWSTTHSLAPFERLINWWNMAVAKKDVNLYAGMGIYMWTGQSGEAMRQVQITNALEHVLGTSVYSYRQIAAAYKQTDQNAKTQMQQLKNLAWQNKAIVPTIAGFTEEKIGSVENFSVEGNKLFWDRLEGAKFYIVYRNGEIADIINGTEDIIVWNDTESGEYLYDVIPLSYTNTLGNPTTKVVEDKESPIHATISLDADGKNLYETKMSYQLDKGITVYAWLTNDAPDASRLAYDWTSSNDEIASISPYGTITTKQYGTVKIRGTLKTNQSIYAEFYINVCTPETALKEVTVSFKNPDGTIIEQQRIQYGDNVVCQTIPTMPSTQKYDYVFIGFQHSLHNITEDIEIYAVYQANIRSYMVTYKNADGTILMVQSVLYGEMPNPPVNPTLDSDVAYTYRFKGWDQENKIIIEDTIITAVYSTIDNSYFLSFETNCDSQIRDQMYYHYEKIDKTSLPIPTREGYAFAGWYQDEAFTLSCPDSFQLVEDSTLYAKWTKQMPIYFYGISNEIYYSTYVEEGTIIYPVMAPILDGYDFIGWTEDLNQNELFDFSQPVYDPLHLYPVYRENKQYTIKYYYNGQVQHTVLVEPLSQLDVLPPELDGYDRFDGWYFDEAFTQPVPTSYEVVESITLYGKITRMYCIRIYGIQGVLLEEIVEEGTNLEDKLLSASQIPVEGYTFVGWNQESTEGYQSVTQNMEIYAIYQLKGGCNCHSSLLVTGFLSMISCFLYIIIRKKD